MFFSDFNSDEGLLSALVSRMGKVIPGFDLRYRDEYRFKRKYSGVSVSGTTVWLPSRSILRTEPMKAFKMLAFAYVLLVDKANKPGTFWRYYWYPHYFFVLALFSLLSICWSPFWLLCLAFLVFLFPLKSHYRALLLIRAYAAVLAVDVWRHGSVKNETRAWIGKKFCDWSHYRVYPDVNVVRGWIEYFERLIVAVDSISGDSIIADSKAYMDIYEVLTDIEWEA
jgi:hypothetical protein